MIQILAISDDNSDETARKIFKLAPTQRSKPKYNITAFPEIYRPDKIDSTTASSSLSRVVASHPSKLSVLKDIIDKTTINHIKTRCAFLLIGAASLSNYPLRKEWKIFRYILIFLRTIEMNNMEFHFYEARLPFYGVNLACQNIKVCNNMKSK